MDSRMTRKLHIFFPHRFAQAAIPFFKNNFPEEDFDFVILSKKDKEDLHIEDVEYVVYNSFIEEIRVLLHLYKSYEHIYLHSSFLSPEIKIVLSLLNKTKKFIWIEWGYDLYPSKSNSIGDFIKRKKRRISQYFFEKRIPYFVAIHPVDVIEYQNRIGGRAKVFVTQYRFSTTQPSFLLNYQKVNLQDKIASGQPLSIQVGHRADSYLNHIKVLERLRAFKDENIRIVLPLSYGNAEYAQVIENYAKQVFGVEKVQVLHELMSYEEYLHFLSSIDVLIIDSNRQIALGNINAMLYMQKKVFLPADSVLMRFFKENKIKIHDITELKAMSWSELIKDEELTNGREFIVKYDLENPVDMWKRVFENMQ